MGSYYSSDTLHYISGRATFKEHDRKSDVYPEIDPKNQGLLFSKNWAAPFYNSPAKTRTKGVIVGISGLNSHHMLNKDELDHLNSQGFATMWMGMPLQDRSLGFMAPLRDMASLFLTSVNSPANMWYSADIPRYILTHSTGGQLFFSLLNRPDTNRRIASLYSGAMHMAPYFDSAGASTEEHPVVQAAWKRYTDMFADKRPHEVFISRAYMRIMAPTEHFTKKGDGGGPTHGQIAEVQENGRELMATFNRAAMQTLPHYFLFGGLDKFACTKVGVKFAQAIGADYQVIPDGNHDPIDGREDLREKYIGKIETCLRAKEAARTAFQLVPYGMNIAPGSEELPELDLNLGDRARLALQSGTRFLNPAARVA